VSRGRDRWSYASRYNRYDRHAFSGWVRLLLVLMVLGLIGALVFFAHGTLPPDDSLRALALLAPFLAALVLGLLMSETPDRH
jgi:hypothetical protein